MNTISYAQSAELTCPECSTTFPTDVWLIVDMSEHPELVDRIVDGTIHHATCPEGHTSMLDAPLLLCGPEARPVLVFSPADQTTREQDREQAQGLLGLLRAELGSDWQDAWLAQMATVPRQVLGTFLTTGPGAALQQLESETQGGMERMREANGGVDLEPLHEPANMTQVELTDEQRVTFAAIMERVHSADEFSAALNEHPDLKAALERGARRGEQDEQQEQAAPYADSPPAAP